MPFVPASELNCAVPTALQYIVRNTRYLAVSGADL